MSQKSMSQESISNESMSQKRKTIASRALSMALMSCVPILMGVASCKNAFSEFADKASDDALLHQAKMEIDEKDWTGAIDAIGLMTNAGKQESATRVVLASAYAGRCGLDLISLADSVIDGTGAGNLLWPTLMTAMKSASASQAADCKSAEQQILAINAAATSRTPDENVLLAFIEFAKMGAVLASAGSDAGANGADTDNDGVLDGGFDACNTSDISDDQVKELGTGITNAVLALAASGSGVAGDVTTKVTAMCTVLDTLLGTTGFCNQTSASDFSAPEVLGLRALIKSNEVGFGTCGGAVGSNGTGPTCRCPNI